MAPSPTPPAMIGTTMKKRVWKTPRPSSAPTQVPTMAATTDPSARGRKILRKPLISTVRSIPKMLPTMIDAMNR